MEWYFRVLTLLLSLGIMTISWQLRAQVHTQEAQNESADMSVSKDLPTLSQKEINRKISNDFFKELPQAAHDMDGNYEDPPLDETQEDEQE